MTKMLIGIILYLSTSCTTEKTFHDKVVDFANVQRTGTYQLKDNKGTREKLISLISSLKSNEINVDTFIDKVLETQNEAMLWELTKFAYDENVLTDVTIWDLKLESSIHASEVADSSIVSVGEVCFECIFRIMNTKPEEPLLNLKYRKLFLIKLYEYKHLRIWLKNRKTLSLNELKVDLDNEIDSIHH